MKRFHSTARFCLPKLQRSLLLAGLLLLAQFFMLFHVLGHMDDSASDSPGEAPCLICVLSTGLDAGYIPVATLFAQTPDYPPQPCESVTPPVRPAKFHAFAVRAPPEASSIA
ncbi:MAG: hypothetical protein KDH88_11960 [Chromatiales bacterium]|nr:hypothetical protein [Chromatiales bacterium]